MASIGQLLLLEPQVNVTMTGGGVVTPQPLSEFPTSLLKVILEDGEDRLRSNGSQRLELALKSIDQSDVLGRGKFISSLRRDEDFRVQPKKLKRHRRRRRKKRSADYIEPLFSEYPSDINSVGFLRQSPPLLGDNLDYETNEMNYLQQQQHQLLSTSARYQQHKNKKPINAHISQQTVNGLLSLLLLFSVSVCGCIGTVFIMSALTLIEFLQTRGNGYLVSLALAHLLVTLLVIPSSALQIMAGDGLDGRLLCHYQWLTLEFSLIVSQLSFMLIAADNYLGYKSSEKVSSTATATATKPPAITANGLTQHGQNPATKLGANPTLMSKQHTSGEEPLSSWFFAQSLIGQNWQISQQSSVATNNKQQKSNKLRLAQQFADRKETKLEPVGCLSYRNCCGRLKVIIWLILVWSLAFVYIFHHHELRYGDEFCAQPAAQNSQGPVHSGKLRTQQNQSAFGKLNGHAATRLVRGDQERRKEAESLNRSERSLAAANQSGQIAEVNSAQIEAKEQILSNHSTDAANSSGGLIGAQTDLKVRESLNQFEKKPLSSGRFARDAKNTDGLHYHPLGSAFEQLNGTTSSTTTQASESLANEPGEGMNESVAGADGLLVFDLVMSQASPVARRRRSGSSDLRYHNGVVQASASKGRGRLFKRPIEHEMDVAAREKSSESNEKNKLEDNEQRQLVKSSASKLVPRAGAGSLGVRKAAKEEKQKQYLQQQHHRQVRWATNLETSYDSCHRNKKRRATDGDDSEDGHKNEVPHHQPQIAAGHRLEASLPLKNNKTEAPSLASFRGDKEPSKRQVSEVEVPELLSVSAPAPAPAPVTVAGRIGKRLLLNTSVTNKVEFPALSDINLHDSSSFGSFVQRSTNGFVEATVPSFSEQNAMADRPKHEYSVNNNNNDNIDTWLGFQARASAHTTRRYKRSNDAAEGGGSERNLASATNKRAATYDQNGIDSNTGQPDSNKMLALSPSANNQVPVMAREKLLADSVSSAGFGSVNQMANNNKEESDNRQQVNENETPAARRKGPKFYYWLMLVGTIIVPSMASSILFARAYLKMKEFKLRPYKPMPTLTMNSTLSRLLMPDSPLPVIAQHQAFTFAPQDRASSDNYGPASETVMANESEESAASEDEELAVLTRRNKPPGDQTFDRWSASTAVNAASNCLAPLDLIDQRSVSQPIGVATNQFKHKPPSSAMQKSQVSLSPSDRCHHKQVNQVLSAPIGGCTANGSQLGPSFSDRNYQASPGSVTPTRRQPSPLWRDTQAATMGANSPRRGASPAAYQQQHNYALYSASSPVHQAASQAQPAQCDTSYSAPCSASFLRCETFPANVDQLAMFVDERTNPRNSPAKEPQGRAALRHQQTSPAALTTPSVYLGVERVLSAGAVSTNRYQNQYADTNQQPHEFRRHHAQSFHYGVNRNRSWQPQQSCSVQVAGSDASYNGRATAYSFQAPTFPTNLNLPPYQCATTSPQQHLLERHRSLPRSSRLHDHLAPSNSQAVSYHQSTIHESQPVESVGGGGQVAEMSGQGQWRSRRSRVKARTRETTMGSSPVQSLGHAQSVDEVIEYTRRQQQQQHLTARAVEGEQVAALSKQATRNQSEQQQLAASLPDSQVSAALANVIKSMDQAGRHQEAVAPGDTDFNWMESSNLEAVKRQTTRTNELRGSNHKVLGSGAATIIKRKTEQEQQPPSHNKAILCTYSYMTDDQLLKSNIIAFTIQLALWLPFIILSVVMQYRENFTYEVKNFVWWLATLNCCSCSYVYAVTNKDFRDAFNKLFYYCCCKSHVTFPRKKPVYRRQLDTDSKGNLRIHIIPGLNVYSSKLSKTVDPYHSHDHSSGGTHNQHQTLLGGGSAFIGSHSNASGFGLSAGGLSNGEREGSGASGLLGSGDHSRHLHMSVGGGFGGPLFGGGAQSHHHQKATHNARQRTNNGCGPSEL